ncbi:MAG: hypothetical protein AB1345_13065 [Chloroflexota bacterium]
MQFTQRFGNFFLFIGAILLVIYLASEMVLQPQYEYLLLAALFIFIGIRLRRKAKPEPEESRYFQSVRKLFRLFSGPEEDTKSKKEQ